MTRSRQPAQTFAPGEYIAEMLHDRGLTEYGIASSAGLTLARVHGIIYHEHVYTEAEAVVIGKYLGTTTELWLNLQAAHLDAACREAAQEQPPRGGKE
jgi:plasmid maintenance system antidote protein VapI